MSSPPPAELLSSVPKLLLTILIRKLRANVDFFRPAPAHAAIPRLLPLLQSVLVVRSLSLLEIKNPIVAIEKPTAGDGKSQET
jgi:hypothetical protein